MRKKEFKNKIKKSTIKKYFRRYLKIAPLSVALCRCIEAANLSTIRIKPPILDIGCGFGEFAQVFFDYPVDMGVDNSPLDLTAASKISKYKNLLLSDARTLPFPDETYTTIVSVSTMEHIKNVDKVFKEAYRILKQDGVFIATVETDAVDKHTFYRPFLKNLGLSFFSEFLTRLFNAFFHRNTLLSKKDWKKRIENAGFIIEESRDIVSPILIKLFDIFIVTAWPSQLLRPIIGKRVVYRPRFIISFLTALFIRYLKEKETTGAILFVVARKPRREEV
ncbi:MAG: class I SAM-dependent methyltransferase [Patescibacteria group bacterium]|nr:class I SAM-dependent methyltransferase [Patescibacteria group bacterium]